MTTKTVTRVKSVSRLMIEYARLLHRARRHPLYTYHELRSRAVLPKAERALYTRMPTLKARKEGMRVYAKRTSPAIPTLYMLEAALQGIESLPGMQYAVIRYTADHGLYGLVYPEGQGWQCNFDYRDGPVGGDASQDIRFGPMHLTDSELEIYVYRPTPEGESDGHRPTKATRKMDWEAHRNRPRLYRTGVRVDLAGQLQAQHEHGYTQRIEAITLPPHKDVYVVSGRTKPPVSFWSCDGSGIFLNLHAFTAVD